MIPRTIKAADLFCGASGTGTGMVEACRELNYEIELTGWNHNPVAIATSQANHPYARHFCAGVDNVNPRDHYKEGELDLLWASPECTHHSIARGGKPINEQSRATAWCVTRFRMLKPHELAAAQGFPKGYIFYGKKKKQGIIVENGNTTDIVKQIGNAVPKNLAKALVKAALTQSST